MTFPIGVPNALLVLAITPPESFMEDLFTLFSEWLSFVPANYLRTRIHS
jgi:hypothetical protein